MSLDNILKKIESDAQKEIEETNKATQQEIAKLNTEASKEQNALQNKLNDELEKERKRHLENNQNEINSRAKSSILQKKQELLNNFYEKVIREIAELPDRDRINILTSLIKKLPNFDGGELLYAEKDKSLINKALNNSKSLYKLSPEYIKNSGGFILRTKEIEIDNTFEALVKQLREDTIIEIGKMLFGK